MDDIRCEWVLVTPPTEEPVSLDELQSQLRDWTENQLGLVRSYGVAGRQKAEEYMFRGLMTQTWKLTLSAFEDVMWLPMAAPLQSVTTVKYYNTDGTLTTLSSTYYTVDTVSRPGAVTRAPGQAWPSVQSDRLSGAVEITYVVGWADADSVPERIKQGIRGYVAYLNYDREGLEERAELALKAAESCWSDVVYWKPPACVAY